MFSSMRLPLFQIQRAILLVVVVTLLLMVAACSSGDETTDSTAEPTFTPMPSPTSLGGTQVSTPIGTPQEDQSRTLTIWWPEPLDPTDDGNVTGVLNEQIEAFSQSEEFELDIEFRLKRPSDVGGIMATLRSARDVAPGVFPDITLMRREDLVAAAQEGLIFPMEGLVPSAMLQDLYPVALRLGQVDSRMYSLAYMLETQFIAHNADTAPESSFDAMLAAGNPLALPAGRSSGLGNVLLAQYVGSGGTPPGDNPSEFQFDPDILEAVYAFYEQGVQTGMIEPEVAQYTSSAAYIPLLTDGDLTAALLNSTTLMGLNAAGARLQTSALPTIDGDPVGMVDGWMWVLTTADPDQQALALDFISWMMRANQHRRYAEVIHMLPSQQDVLQDIDAQLIDNALTDEILSNGIIVENTGTTGSILRALQSGLLAILAAEGGAEDVAQAVIAEFND